MAVASRQAVNGRQISNLKILAISLEGLLELINEEAEANPFLKQPEYATGVGKAAGFDLNSIEDEHRVSFKYQLLDQISELELRQSQVDLAVELVDRLDERGLLQDSDELVSAPLFASTLARLQTLDPPGVFARSLSECYSIQLRRRGSLSVSLVRFLEHVDALGAFGLEHVCNQADLSLAEAQSCLESIRRLSPWPTYGSDSVTGSEYCIPEVVIDFDAFNKPIVKFQNQTEDYIQLAEQAFIERALVESSAHKKNDGRRAELASQLNTAKDLISAVSKRQATIYKITSVLAAAQREFLSGNTDVLNCISMKDVADMVGVHESTVSRAVKHEFAITPRGVVELRALFFTNEIRSSSQLGVSFARTDVQRCLMEIVRQEQEPLSDSQISRVLAGQGYDVSRRTVAKYRSQLGIPAAAQRS